MKRFFNWVAKAFSNQIIEFRLDGFNDRGIEEAFFHILEIYNKILSKDPLWHYFYEGPYSLIRCSRKYTGTVKKYLDKHCIKYKWPVYPWREGMHVTVRYQHIYRHIFHYNSVLALEMYKAGDSYRSVTAADRIIHSFFNQSLYPAKKAGLCDSYEDAEYTDFQYWEAQGMADLAIGRAYHIGRIVEGRRRKK